MKRLLKALLVMTLFFGLTISVQADNGDGPAPLPNDMTHITVEKALETTGGNPEETFNFTVGTGILVDGAGSAPTIAGFGIKVLAGQDLGQHDLELPGFNQVGTFKYEIKETAGNTAGMTYDLASRFLIIQVINGADGLIRIAYLTDANGLKLEEPILANNEFHSGDLEFEKVMVGNYINPDDTFTITVTLTAKAGKTFNDEKLLATGADSYVVDGNKITLTYTVSDKSKFTIQDIPFDVDYAIIETGFDGYDPEYEVSYTNANGAVNDGEIFATITNTRNRDIETGITLDNMPYFLALGFAVGGLGYVFVRRRRREEF